MSKKLCLQLSLVCQCRERESEIVTVLGMGWNNHMAAASKVAVPHSSFSIK